MRFFTADRKLLIGLSVLIGVLVANLIVAGVLTHELIENSRGERTYHWVLLSGLLACLCSLLSGAVLVFREVGHRKRRDAVSKEHAEALQAAGRRKDEFLATLAHE